MSGFEYKVVPAPTRGLKGKGIKGTQARFANALQTVMNELGADGWEYQRTDTLPVEERQGLTGKTTSFQNMLVFRRALSEEVDEAPVVAALIEDQTDDAVRPEPVMEPADETPVEASVATAAPDVEEVPPAEAEAKADVDDAERAPEARERISETLKAEPFTFPWNRRRQVPKAKDDVTAASETVR